MLFPDFPALLDDVHHAIRTQVAAGFADADTIIDTTLAVYEDEADPAVLLPHVERFVADVLAAHLAEQATWPAVTDCDRLDAAFAALEEAGIVCRQHFSCCGTCGAAEIWDELALAEEAGRTVRGYAFYHIQDTESAVDGHGLYLNYGALEAGAPAALAVARDVVAELERQGLRTNWNGRWSQRIGVNLTWQRRRASAAACA